VRFVWRHDVVGERADAAGLDHLRIPMRNEGDLTAVMALRSGSGSGSAAGAAAMRPLARS
jgi:hypothetical protein